MFLVCGEALFDFFLESESGPGIATYDARAGGSPFNVAIGLSRLEQESGLLTGLSTDLLGQRLRQVLKNENVSTGYAVTTDRPSTLSLVGLDTEGIPAYQFYDSNSAGTGLTEAELSPIGDEVTGFHFGSFSLVAPPVADTFTSLTQRYSDKFISIDPNVRPNVEPDMDIWRERLVEFYRHANLVKISSEDLETLNPGISSENFAADLISTGVKMVVVTDGDGPAFGWLSSGITATAAPPKSEIVDTVGAGDTFQAALIAQLLGDDSDPIATMDTLDGEKLTFMLAFAARAAAITCTRRGADLPRMSELK